MSNELNIDALNDAIKQVESSQILIVGVVVSPNDYLALKEKAKAIYGWDSDKIFEIPLYGGIDIYISERVPDGNPLPLTRRRNELPTVSDDLRSLLC